MTSGNEHKPERKHVELGGIARGASLGFVSKVFRFALLFVFGIAAARLLGKEVFGVYMLAFGTITISVQISMLGLDRGTVRFVAQYIGDNDDARLKGTLVLALLFGCVAGVSASAILYALSSFIGLTVYDEPTMISALALMACAVPFHVIMFISLAATRGFKEMKSTALIEDIIHPTVYLVLFVVLAYRQAGIMAAAWSYFASTLLAMTMALFFVRRKHPAFDRTAVAVYSPKLLITTSVPLGLAALGGWLYTWLGSLILGTAATGADVAVFQAAMRITFILLFISMPFNLMVAPALSDLYNKQDRDALRSVYRTVSRWVLACNAPLTVSLIVMSRDWMGLFGESFQVGAPCLVIISLATLANGTFGPSFWMLQMCGRQLTAMMGTVVLISTLAVSTIVFSRLYGAVGAAMATATAVTAFDVMLAVVVYRYFRFHFLSKSLVKIFVASIVCLAVGYGTRHVLGDTDGMFTIIRLILGSAAIGLSYLAMILALRLEPDDMALLNSIRLPVVVKTVAVLRKYGIAK